MKYLETQCKRNTKHQKNENSSNKLSLDDFVISPYKLQVRINMCIEKDTMCIKRYETLEMKRYIKTTNHQNFHKILHHIKEEGLPMLLANHDIYHFNLPSKGCHEAVHFIWKQKMEDKQSPEQLRLVDELKEKEGHILYSPG